MIEMLLKDRIISTLHFFDLLDYPVTLLELHRFLLSDLNDIKRQINNEKDLVVTPAGQAAKVEISQVAECLDGECREEIEQKNGFYCLKGRAAIIGNRQANYLYGIKRERRIRRYSGGLRHIPFVRGVGLAGSQAHGAQKKDSDIDLLIIVDPKFLWLARTLVTGYFQILGNRRHGRKVVDRFCLNHYLAGVKQVSELRNLYTAWEYAKLRPLVYGQVITEYQRQNFLWMSVFFPNFEPFKTGGSRQSRFQELAERLLRGPFGQWLEIKLKNWQLHRIRQEKFILVRDDELSFHPQSKQRELLRKFFSESPDPQLLSNSIIKING